MPGDSLAHPTYEAFHSQVTAADSCPAERETVNSYRRMWLMVIYAAVDRA